MGKEVGGRDIQIVRELYFLILKGVPGRGRGRGRKVRYDDGNFYNCTILTIPRFDHGRGAEL